jgi:hypothetical protein
MITIPIEFLFFFFVEISAQDNYLYAKLRVNKSTTVVLTCVLNELELK